MKIFVNYSITQISLTKELKGEEIAVNWRKLHFAMQKWIKFNFANYEENGSVSRTIQGRIIASHKDAGISDWCTGSRFKHLPVRAQCHVMVIMGHILHTRRRAAAVAMVMRFELDAPQWGCTTRATILQ